MRSLFLAPLWLAAPRLTRRHTARAAALFGATALTVFAALLPWTQIHRVAAALLAIGVASVAMRWCTIHAPGARRHPLRSGDGHCALRRGCGVGGVSRVAASARRTRRSPRVRFCPQTFCCSSRHRPRLRTRDVRVCAQYVPGDGFGRRRRGDVRTRRLHRAVDAPGTRVALYRGISRRPFHELSRPARRRRARRSPSNFARPATRPSVSSGIRTTRRGTRDSTAASSAGSTSGEAWGKCCGAVGSDNRRSFAADTRTPARQIVSAIRSAEFVVIPKPGGDARRRCRHHRCTARLGASRDDHARTSPSSTSSMRTRRTPRRPGIARALRRLPEARDLHDGEIAYVDDEIRRLLAMLLQARGALDNTIVVITADHGEQFREHGISGHGNSLYYQLLHVPLVIRYDGHLPRGRRGSRFVVSLRDVGATLLDLAGAPARRSISRGVARLHLERNRLAPTRAERRDQRAHAETACRAPMTRSRAHRESRSSKNDGLHGIFRNLKTIRSAPVQRPQRRRRDEESRERSRGTNRVRRAAGTTPPPPAARYARGCAARRSAQQSVCGGVIGSRQPSSTPAPQ